MSCAPSYFVNLISTVPDEQNYQISPASATGFYVVYPPSSTTPIPIYHTTGDSTYSGWSTSTSLNCQGNSNYPTGKCQLIYARVEESPNIWLSQGTSPVHKTEITLSGRTVQPKLCQDVFIYPEVYCFYTTSQERIKNITPDLIKSNWNLGHISYRQIPGQVLVNEKVFGTPIAADLRTIGKYSAILGSYNLSNQLDESGLNMPEVVEN